MTLSSIEDAIYHVQHHLWPDSTEAEQNTSKSILLIDCDPTPTERLSNETAPYLRMISIYPVICIAIIVANVVKRFFDGR
jgi:hypothetical protein